jgi:hypothetical protein
VAHEHDLDLLGERLACPQSSPARSRMTRPIACSAGTSAASTLRMSPQGQVPISGARCRRAGWQHPPDPEDRGQRALPDPPSPTDEKGKGGEQRATRVELFFDLVFVFAITQLPALLVSDISFEGAVRVLFLQLVVWWAWI